MDTTLWLWITVMIIMWKIMSFLMVIMLVELYFYNKISN